MKRLLAAITAALLCLTMTACSNNSKYIIPEGETAYDWGVSVEYVKAREKDRLLYQEQNEDDYSYLMYIPAEQPEKGTCYSCTAFYFENDKLAGIIYVITREDVTNSQTIEDYIDYLSTMTEKYGTSNKAYYYGSYGGDWVTNDDGAFPTQEDWATVAEDTSHSLVLNDTWLVGDTVVCLQNNSFLSGSGVIVNHWLLSSELYHEKVKKYLVYDPT